MLLLITNPSQTVYEESVFIQQLNFMQISTLPKQRPSMGTKTFGFIYRNVQSNLILVR